MWEEHGIHYEVCLFCSAGKSGENRDPSIHTQLQTNEVFSNLQRRLDIVPVNRASSSFGSRMDLHQILV